MKGIIVSEMGSLLRRPSLSGSKGGDTSGLMMGSAVIKSNVQEKKRDHVLHARYYAIITFNQIMLSSSQVDREVAKSLVDLYFELFRLAITADDPTERKEGIDRDPKGRQERRKDKERLKQQHPASNGGGQFSEIKDGNEKYLSAILTGLHRALPYAAHDAGL
jgi:ribosome biogenesis protein MAK21